MIEIEPVCAWETAERELPARVAAELAGTGVVKTVPIEPPHRWRIEADSRVGILVGDGWELRIRPHIGIPKLLFLLTYSLRPEGWEGVLTGLSSERDVVQALACAFSMHAESAVDHGLLRGYVSVQERLGELRGRVRFGDQLAQLPGLPLPLEVAYEDFTVDVAENRLLRSATEVLLGARGVSAHTRARLVGLRKILEQVGASVARPPVQLPLITPLNRPYEPALVLAKLILDGTSLRLQRGPIAAQSFLFDLNEVFESFLFTALRESLRPFGGTVLRQAWGALDVARQPGLPFRADIIWRKHGRIQAVIDSKYKSVLAAGATPNADAYQMLAYCIGFGVQHGFLIYARDGLDHPRLYEIKQHGYQIDARAVGLEQEPEQLLDEVSRIAAAVASAALTPREATAGVTGTRPR